MTPPVSQL